jgi:hypothetical protein
MGAFLGKNDSRAASMQVAANLSRTGPELADFCFACARIFPPPTELVRRAIEFSCTRRALNHINVSIRKVSVTVMALTESSLHDYRKAAPSNEKWSWAQTVLFILLTCGGFWAAVIALVLSRT